MYINPNWDVSGRSISVAAARIVHGPFGRVVTRAPAGRQVAHAHRQAELLVVLDGHATLDVDGAILPLGGGSGALLAPMRRHSVRVGNAARTRTLGVLLDPYWIKATCGLDTAHLAAVMPITHEAVLVAREIAALLERSPRASKAVGDAIAELSRHCLAFIASPDHRPDAAPDLDRRLARSLDRMLAALSERTPIESIARHNGLSRPHFFKLFQRAMNVTPAIYLNMLRIEQAVREMAETDRPVGRVADDLGFTAQANFTRFFRGVEGMSPSEYRRAAAVLA